MPQPAAKRGYKRPLKASHALESATKQAPLGSGRGPSSPTCSDELALQPRASYIKRIATVLHTVELLRLWVAVRGVERRIVHLVLLARFRHVQREVGVGDPGEAMRQDHIAILIRKLEAHGAVD